MQLSHARRNSLITGVATLVVASAATASLAIPQVGDKAEAAAPVAAVSVDGKPVTDQAEAGTAAAAQTAQTQQAAQTQADADAAAAAQAQAQAQAAARAQAEAEAKAQADAKAKADADAAASRSQQRQSLSGYSGTPQQIAAQIVPAGQLQCFSNIVFRESSWNPLAVNASSGAYGLVQALPGSKMASTGSDWRTNPATQIKWGLDYMNSRYGSPCGAWSFWQKHHWY
ncbi:transglycosylase SLT domain-containing protein [Kitasatospora sp. NPDC004745]|uniref:aggregation-promoting factor C-terminal-like domain-containing protein n=1 Tax=Kitasatospora sp. NPDC004745 TaxID=3364019 RepID=UPI0036CAA145